MHLPSDNKEGIQSIGSSSTSGRMNSNAEPDFSEFMWMAEEDLEAFDREVSLKGQNCVVENDHYDLKSRILFAFSNMIFTCFGTLFL